jgi:hypothetical protein
VSGDDGAGLYYFGARYYDPELGNWGSTDPLDEYYNTYSYCGGDQINFWDPNGMGSEGNTTNTDGIFGYTAPCHGDEVSVKGDPTYTESGVGSGNTNGPPPVPVVLAPSQLTRSETAPSYQNTNSRLTIIGESNNDNSSSNNNSPYNGPNTTTGSIWTKGPANSGPENAFRHWEKHGGEFPEYKNAKQYTEKGQKIY